MPNLKNLTFSQAQGLEPLPSPLALGELSDDLRNAIYGVLHESISNSSKYVVMTTFVKEPWLEVLRAKHVRFDRQRADSFKTALDEFMPDLEGACFHAPYNTLFDLLQFIMRQPACPKKFILQLKELLEEFGAAYRVVMSPGPSIVPVSTPEEGRAIQQAFGAIGTNEFAGARKHLHDAGVYLGQPGKEADSVRESIHAVEAVCKVLAGTPDATLTAALNRLKNKAPMHPAFVTGLEKLYSYTNDEKGIRHALLGDEAKVDPADAQLMFGACASFVSYLIGKARSAGLT